MIERTLSIIKPDAIIRNLANKIILHIKESGLNIIAYLINEDLVSLKNDIKSKQNWTEVDKTMRNELLQSLYSKAAKFLASTAAPCP